MLIIGTFKLKVGLGQVHLIAKSHTCFLQACARLKLHPNLQLQKQKFVTFRETFPSLHQVKRLILLPRDILLLPQVRWLMNWYSFIQFKKKKKRALVCVNKADMKSKAT